MSNEFYYAVYDQYKSTGLAGAKVALTFLRAELVKELRNFDGQYEQEKALTQRSFTVTLAETHDLAKQLEERVWKMGERQARMYGVAKSIEVVDRLLSDLEG